MWPALDASSPGRVRLRARLQVRVRPAAARQLLAEAGYPNGFRTQLYAPSGRYLKDIEVAEAVQAMLADVGIQAEIVTMEWATYLDVTGQRAEDNPAPMIMLGWGTVTGDADYGLYPLFHTSQWVPAGSSRSFYSNAEVDRLLELARANPDPEVRLEAYREAMAIIMEEAPWLFLHAEVQLTAPHRGGRRHRSPDGAYHGSRRQLRNERTTEGTAGDGRAAAAGGSPDANLLLSTEERKR